LLYAAAYILRLPSRVPAISSEYCMESLSTIIIIIFPD